MKKLNCFYQTNHKYQATAGYFTIILYSNLALD